MVQLSSPAYSQHVQYTGIHSRFLGMEDIYICFLKVARKFIRYATRVREGWGRGVHTEQYFVRPSAMIGEGRLRIGRGKISDMLYYEVDWQNSFKLLRDLNALTVIIIYNKSRCILATLEVENNDEIFKCDHSKCDHLNMTIPLFLIFSS